MGTGCCSDGPAKGQGCSGPSTEVQHGHDHGRAYAHGQEIDPCCSDGADCGGAEEVACVDEDCDAETYCEAEDDSTCRSVKLECCTSKEEHCDGIHSVPV